MNITVEAEALIPVLAAEYALPAPTSCTFLRRGFNDHYLVTAGEHQYVLRLYFQDKYYIAGPDDFRWELDLLSFLDEHGVPVSSAVPRVGGDRLGTLATAGGTRHYALFTFAPGATIRDMTAAQARALGRVIAQFHVTADAFHSGHHRYEFDLRYLTEQPMALLDAFLRERGRGSLDRYRPAVAAQETLIRAVPEAPGAYGVIHGDLHRGNFHVTPEGGVTVFDFDHGGYGWRAYDLATCKRGLSAPAWGALLQSYEAVRPLSSAEHASLEAFAAVRPIWDKGDILAMRSAWGPDEEFGDAFAAEIIRTFETLAGGAASA